MGQFIHEVPDEKVYTNGPHEDKRITELVGLDYVAECDKTASNTFAPANVGDYELIIALRNCQRAAEILNRYKKVLFRKQSRQEAMLPPFNQSHAGKPLSILEAAGHDDLFHGVIGVATEAGELCEYLADCLEGKRKFDVVNVREETGDVLWYLTRLIKWAGTSFLTEMKRNIAKLRKRHGAGGFNKEADMNRDLAAEAEVIRKGIG